MENKDEKTLRKSEENLGTIKEEVPSSFQDCNRSKQELEGAQNLLLLVAPKNEDVQGTEQKQKEVREASKSPINHTSNLPQGLSDHIETNKKGTKLLDTLADLACREVETETIKVEKPDWGATRSDDNNAPRQKRLRSMSEGYFHRVSLPMDPWGSSVSSSRCQVLFKQEGGPSRDTPPIGPGGQRSLYYPLPLHRRPRPPSFSSLSSPPAPAPHSPPFRAMPAPKEAVGPGTQDPTSNPTVPSVLGNKEENEAPVKPSQRVTYSSPMDLMPSLGLHFSPPASAKPKHFPAREQHPDDRFAYNMMKRTRPHFSNQVHPSGRTPTNPIPLVDEPSPPSRDDEGTAVDLQEHSSHQPFSQHPRRDSMELVGLSAAEIVAEYQALEKQEGQLPLPHAFSRLSHIYNQHGRIGIYTPAERAAILERFRQKRERRIWKKKIRYNCRKNLADKRHRVKGRFVKSTSIHDDYRHHVALHQAAGNILLYQSGMSSISPNHGGSSDADSSDVSITSSPISEDEPIRVRRHSIAF
mmetsp:Transcript_30374/g.39205  ORF Transcript_30374/g.39205 Transcript_30374/m.39205 type:complete len:525 (+) Transcript_30374:240-1814(+)